MGHSSQIITDTRMNIKIGIIGLGYVGLPLAVEFSKKYITFGYDISNVRVEEINKHEDSTNEISSGVLKKLVKIENKNKYEKGLYITSDYNKLTICNFYIITVPTPTDLNKRPNLNPLINASKTVSKLIKKGDYVVYESTVYPGVTEDICVPFLEKGSSLKLNTDFFVGYSPERINPGDKERSFSNIIKVTSGSDTKSAKFIDKVYNTVVKAGTYLAKSIKVAEASKVIENSQRDVNIAFVNELAKIFEKMNIDTKDVLEAASSKWNFLNFKPGLVGGHCIGVDPYYLAQKAEESGYYPEMILVARRINDSMGKFIVQQTIKKSLVNKINLINSKALILGFTFKENCPDYRNTKVIDIYKGLRKYDIDVDVLDPYIDKLKLYDDYKINLKSSFKDIKSKYNIIIIAVSHVQFLKVNLRKYLLKPGIIYDVKSVMNDSEFTYRL